ncbi:hypothetical protein HDU85_001083 [Gaertneriomyces sp. JEL0708]|nr:hypothetical protein HDU85_001083 [Gaertneriomyces sp. JEL0708]
MPKTKRKAQAKTTGSISNGSTSSSSSASDLAERATEEALTAPVLNVAVKKRSLPGDAALDKSPQNVTLLVDEAKSKKWQNAFVRSVWTFVMVFLFLVILLAGHVWVVLLVGLLQTLVYKEVISIGISPAKEQKLPWNRFLHWYFLCTTNYFLYGETIIEYFKPYVVVDAFLMPLATHHRFISFSLYCVGLVLFVMNLKKGHYKFQFSQFGWTHMVLLVVVCQSHFIINNIFEGLIWFLVPASLVIWNDIAAYIFGFFFGRTPLIALSPKKTWEGFLGAFFTTVAFGWFLSGFLAHYPYMYCPMRDLKTSSFSGVECVPNPAFVPTDYRLPPMLSGLLRYLMPFAGIPFRTLTLYPVQLHSLVLSIFASVVAPFGGFFASGFKRAVKIKDFGDTIPGHGGVTDRMDCQFLMGLFSYMYVKSFVGVGKLVTVGSLLQSAIQGLSSEEVKDLIGGLKDYLEGQGVDL